MDLGFFKKSIPTLLFLIVFSFIGVTVFYQLMSQDERLKIYNPIDINPRLVDISVKNLKKNHTISDFELTNQNGKTITQEYYKNKIYVADFFFTTCQSICPIMTKNMLEVQKELKNDKDILLLSHTVMPEIDSVQQLKKYALENRIDDNKWNLVTGDKKQIYDLARKSYLAVEDSEFGNFDMIHTENFMLIDKQRQIRGFYDGTDKKEIERLLLDIEILKNLN